MTYSYIKSVFPDFTASKVYDERTYNNITLGNGVAKAQLKTIEPYHDNQLQNFTASQPFTASQNLMSFEEKTPSPILNQKSIQLEPIDISNYKEYKEYKELFENNKTDLPLKIPCDIDCDSHINHVLTCVKCKQMITKQLNLNFDKERNEEIMELVSYMLFGVFVLLIIDNLTNK